MAKQESTSRRTATKRYKGSAWRVLAAQEGAAQGGLAAESTLDAWDRSSERIVLRYPNLPKALADFVRYAREFRGIQHPEVIVVLDSMPEADASVYSSLSAGVDAAAAEKLLEVAGEMAWFTFHKHGSGGAVKMYATQELSTLWKSVAKLPTILDQGEGLPSLRWPREWRIEIQDSEGTLVASINSDEFSLPSTWSQK